MGLKRALRAKMNMTVPKSDLMLEEDPFLMLGFGLNSYFQVVIQLLVMVCFITLFILPLLWIFSSYDNLAALPGYDFNQYTLGNMGGADAYCAQSGFSSKEMAIPIKCSTGVISLDAIAVNTGKPIFDVGIIHANSSENTFCNSAAFEDTDNCSSFLDKG